MLTRSRNSGAGGGETGDRDDEEAGRNDGDALRRQDEDAAEYGADQDGEKRAGLDQRVAGEQLVRREVGRQNAVFDRPEEGRMDPHQEQDREQQHNMTAGEAGHRDRHEDDLGGLDRDDQLALLEFVGEKPRRGRKQEERQDEQPRRRRDQDLPIEPGLLRQPIGHQDDECVLEEIIVERAQELGDEERQEAAALEQREWAMAHGPRL